MAAATQREIQAHLVRSVLAAQQDCAPELLDLIHGSTISEIDESVARVKATTQQILNRARQAQIRPSDQDDPGPSFVVNQREGIGDRQPLTAEAAAAWDMATYAARRAELGMDRPKDEGIFSGLR